MANKTFPKIKTVSATDQAALDRLVSDERRPRSKKGVRVDTTTLGEVFKKSSRDTTDTENVFRLLPWLHLPREILVSSITSPGDLVQVMLTINNRLKTIPPSLSNRMDKVLKDFFLDEQQLESKIYDWVDDALIASGAHPILIIPEASLDKIIKGRLTDSSLESLSRYDGEFVDGWFKPKGILGIKGKGAAHKDVYVSVESASRFSNSMADLHTIKSSIKTNKSVQDVILPIRVTDNLAAFRKPIVDKLSRTKQLHRIYGHSAFEAVSKKRYDDEDIYKEFFKKPKLSTNDKLEIVPVSEMEENKELGHPLVYHLPKEAVIPIFVPGDPSNHTYYIIITDKNGYPVSYTSKVDFYDDIRNSMISDGSEGSSAGSLLKMARDTMAGNVKDISPKTIDNLLMMHTDIIEQDIINRIRAGLMGGEFEMSMPDQVKRMMLARSLSSKESTMILVPADYMVYMAYDYSPYGTGKTLLEDGMGLIAQTAAVHVANVLGSVQNSIPGKDINIELDPDDQDPLESAHFMVSEALGLAYRQFPLTIGNTAGLTEQLQLSSFNINVKNNPNFPEINTSITQRESAKVEIDTEYMDRLKSDIVKLFGLTPEMVDNINQPEFATTAVNSSMLLLKRVMTAQAKTNPFLTDYVRIFTYNSGVLINRLLEVLDTNKKEIPKEYKNPTELLEEYLDNVFCELPQPQTENTIKQAEMLDKMTDSIDKFLDAYFKKEYLAGFDNPAIEESYDVLRESFKGLLLRKWMRDHGIFRELDVFSTNEDGSVLADLNAEMNNYTAVLREMIGKYYEDIADYVERHKATTKRIVEKGEKAKDDGMDEEDDTSDDEEGFDDSNPLGDDEGDELGEDEGDENEETEEPEEDSGDTDSEDPDDFSFDEPPAL